MGYTRVMLQKPKVQISYEAVRSPEHFDIFFIKIGQKDETSDGQKAVLDKGESCK